ncbi:MAG: phosphatidylinositol kinase, partial [Acidobacteriaceae bacterium]
EWNFPDTTRRAIYVRRCVYQGVCGWQSFEPWLSRIESFDALTLREIAADVPAEWIEPEKLAQLVESIDARRSRVRELITEVQQSQHNPFGAWRDEKP